jgi:uncharacterized protein involved in response to NO
MEKIAYGLSVLSIEASYKWQLDARKRIHLAKVPGVGKMMMAMFPHRPSAKSGKSIKTEPQRQGCAGENGL